MSDPSPVPQPPPSSPYASPYTPPYAPAYATAYTPVAGPPASIKAIGITGVILGGLTVLFHVFSLVLIAVAPRLVTGQYGPAYGTFQLCNSLVFGPAAAVLAAGSIGTLARAEWGRRLTVAWAVVYPCLLVVLTVAMVAWVIPSLMAPRLTGPTAQTVIAGAYFGAIVVVLALLVLPGFVLAYFRRPYVRAAFAPPARP